MKKGPFFHEVHIKGDDDHHGKGKSRTPVNCIGRKLKWCITVEKIFDERGREVRLAEFALYLPMPVGQEAIAHAVPQSQHQPGKQGGSNHHEVRFTGAFPYPSCKIEDNDHDVCPE